MNGRISPGSGCAECLPNHPGDEDSELGTGLALQAGARSAIGTLWYVDDVVTSAFFVQFYRFLDQGVPKAEALLRTRRLFSSGGIRLVNDQVLSTDGAPC